YRPWSENEIPLPGSCRQDGRRHGERRGTAPSAATSTSFGAGPAGSRARERETRLTSETAAPFGWMGCIWWVSITHGRSCSVLYLEISERLHGRTITVYSVL